MKILFIFISSILLIIYSLNNQKKFEFSKVSPLIKSQFEFFQKGFHSRSKASILIALILGDKRWLPHAFRKILKIMALNHLFTPSGLHLTSILFALIPVLKLFKRKRHKIELTFISLLTVAIYMLPDLYSLKRIALYRLFSLILKPWRIKSFTVFLSVFTIDFLFGTYKYSPLSFSLSYFFLGIILASTKEAAIKIPFLLALGQIIVSFLFDRAVYPISLFINFCLSCLFSYYYPVLFLCYILKLISPINYLITYFEKVTFYSYQISTTIDPFYPTIPLILTWGIFLTKTYWWSGKMKLIIFIFLFLIHSNPVDKDFPRKFLKKNKIITSDLIWTK